VILVNTLAIHANSKCTGSMPVQSFASHPKTTNPGRMHNTGI